MATQLIPLGPLPPDPIQQDVRIQQTATDATEQNQLTIGIQQHDEAVLYYFREVIKPTVEQNNDLISVPVFVGHREAWESVRKQSFYRDSEGKLYFPIITLKRTRLEKVRDMGGKLDANKPQILKTFEKQYNARNQYDSFNLYSGVKPERELVHVGIPDYVKLTYEGIIQTYYMPQMNSLIEAIEYASDSYWGPPSAYKFRATIDSFSDATDVSIGEDRIIQSKFTMTINGYLLPDITQRKIVESAPRFTPGRIMVSETII